MNTLLILVPKPGTSPHQHIDEASGIVTAMASMRPSTPDETTGEIVVYYEGNRHGFDNLTKINERILVAAGRLTSAYPTVARSVFKLDDFVVVGHVTYAVDWSTYNIEITDHYQLAVWCGL